MVLVLSTLPDSVLYLYQVLSKYLIGFQSYGPEHRSNLGWPQMLTDGQTNRQKTVSLYRAMPKAGATKWEAKTKMAE